MDIKRFLKIIKTYSFDDGLTYYGSDQPFSIILNEGDDVEVRISCTFLFSRNGEVSYKSIEDLDLFEQCYKDCYELSEDFGAEFAPYLYCARVEKMRPQGACYPIYTNFWPLFDACGPVREINEENPEEPGSVPLGHIDYFGFKHR